MKEFSEVYENLPLKKKRMLNHALFSAIVSYIKRGENSGEIEIRIRGNGSLKRTWEDMKKENQVRQVRTPGSLGSASRIENSNYILLRIPIEIHLFQRGLQALCMDPGRLGELLGLSARDIERLGQAGLVHLLPTTRQLKERVSHSALAAPRR